MIETSKTIPANSIFPDPPVGTVVVVIVCVPVETFIVGDVCAPAETVVIAGGVCAPVGTAVVVIAGGAWKTGSYSS